VPSNETGSASEATSSSDGADGAMRTGRQAWPSLHCERGTATPANPISDLRVKPQSIAGGAGGAGTGGTGTIDAPPLIAGFTTAAAQRILTLATESLDMMRGVTVVMKENLDRADV